MYTNGETDYATAISGNMRRGIEQQKRLESDEDSSLLSLLGLNQDHGRAFMPPRQRGISSS